jgi:hypothetical protein
MVRGSVMPFLLLPTWLTTCWGLQHGRQVATNKFRCALHLFKLIRLVCMYLICV